MENIKVELAQAAVKKVYKTPGKPTTSKDLIKVQAPQSVQARPHSNEQQSVGMTDLSRQLENEESPVS